MSEGDPLQEGRGRVLVVDDEEALARAYGRRLDRAGFVVDTAGEGREAARLLGERPYDAILSDISMPGLSGIDLLRLVRQRDLDVPVILATGAPSIDTAASAVEHGAYRYLLKPIDLGELAATVESAVRVGRLARIKRQALELLANGGQGIGDRVGLEVRFDRALSGLWMAFQPIVSWEKRRLFAYEALVRTAEPTLPHPGALFDAAERLGRVRELGREVRRITAEAFAAAPEGETLFVNLHTADLTEVELFQPTAPLSQISRRVVLEVTERAAIDGIRDLRARALALRNLGFRLAIDDLGAGYSGLNSFALLEPEVAKVDMSLVRDVHREPMKQRIVRSMVSLCRDAGILVVAEGVETVEERDQLAALGCDLMQGYLFAKPGRPFPEVRL